jgi:hypothetical protein
MTRELQFWSWIWCYKEDMPGEFKMVFLRFGRIHMCAVHCTSEFINALEIPAKVVVLFYPVLPDCWRNIAFRRFPGFVHLSWLEQHSDEGEYEATVLWYWQAKPKCWEKNLSHFHLSTTNLTRADLGLNCTCIGKTSTWITFKDPVHTTQ